LPVATRFVSLKATHQVTARVIAGRGLLAQAKHSAISGYEIHMGQTYRNGMTAPFRIEKRSAKICSDDDGALSADGNVIGTYIHGLFHNDGLRDGVLQELGRRKGQTFAASPVKFSADEQYDKLAAHVRASLNMELIQRILDQQ
jgi:adenosylcobyric acid synthase